MTQKLIVNADDYGHTQNVSEGIRRAHLQGIVSSTTAMMNRPAVVSELPKALELCPKLGLGVHLVLTTGVPILPASRVPGLVDGKGRFLRREDLIRHLPEIDPDEVDAEWHAQVELFIKIAGRSPDHLDSHHHSSFFTPLLLERMLRLAEELKCPIRNPFNDVAAPVTDYLPGTQPEADLASAKALLERYQPVTPQHFISSFYDETASPVHLLELLGQISIAPLPQTWEIMCHPGISDDELRQVSDYNDMRGNELSLLTDPTLPELLKSMDIELTKFQ